MKAKASKPAKAPVGIENEVDAFMASLKHPLKADIEKVRVDLEPARREEMMQRTGRRTVPQIYVGDRHVGGYDDLAALDRAGGLEPLLAA